MQTTMRKAFRPVVMILLVLGGALAVVGVSRYVTPPEIVPWRTDFALASEEAKSQRKPMLVDFSAEWCGPCQYMRHTTWADRHVAGALQAYVPVKVDPDRQGDLVRRFNVSAFPTILVLDDEEQVVKRQEGALLPDEFLQWLR